MNELIKRSLTGIVYILLFISAIFLGTHYYNILFLVLGFICVEEFKKLILFNHFWPNLIFVVFWAFFTYFNPSAFVSSFLLGASLAINLLLCINLFTDVITKNRIITHILFLIFYLIAGIIFLIQIPYSNNGFNKHIILGILCIVWTNDTFAYLTGKLFGKHKLLEKVSPKKTIEGFIGGLIFALITGILFSKIENSLTVYQWVILALVTIITGTIGDLVESKFKRNANIKDSGAILPGHGGFLDRLDSLLYAAPFIVLTLYLF